MDVKVADFESMRMASEEEYDARLVDWSGDLTESQAEVTVWMKNVLGRTGKSSKHLPD